MSPWDEKKEPNGRSYKGDCPQVPGEEAAKDANWFWLAHAKDKDDEDQIQVHKKSALLTAPSLQPLRSYFM